MDPHTITASKDKVTKNFIRYRGTDGFSYYLPLDKAGEKPPESIEITMKEIVPRF